ncbi:hypothetical protein D8X55_01065 [Malacoplasma penetrans]|uniref:Uncharacterized protein n=1 Tax=Malacoplasma penetrans (strain HF-2) TaxID=272633 RepID=Q8EVS2_MALP2|nr:hypothetical protein [Malacoplasma penetrans]RXY97274.1 hypothetical protein D8X55_01065 [Malacoplasma penetrans]BAC44277.1 hypothetical protein [Malacoplasma penetrans HF-2]
MDKESFEELKNHPVGKELSELYKQIICYYTHIKKAKKWIKEKINPIYEKVKSTKMEPTYEVILHNVYTVINDSFKYKLLVSLRSFLEILKSNKDKYKHKFKEYFLDMLKEVSSKNETKNYYLNSLIYWKKCTDTSKNETIDLDKISAIYSELSKAVHPSSGELFEVWNPVKKYIENFDNWNVNMEIDKLCDLLSKRNIMSEKVLNCDINEKGLYNNLIEQKWIPFNDLDSTQKPFAIKKYLYWTKESNCETCYFDWFLNQILDQIIKKFEI